MKLTDRVREIIHRGKRTVLGVPPDADPRDRVAWEVAVGLWNEVFEPFSPLIDDADVLELGCGDGRLAAALAETGGARWVVGLDSRAGWRGDGEGVGWDTATVPRLELHGRVERLESLDPGAFDLILCRDLDGLFPLEGLEDLLARLYGLLRPGAGALLRLGCAGPGPERGYGFMTPTTWIALTMRAGFEIVGQRRIWCDPSEQNAAAERLPRASDDERLTVEIRLHLLRPWESWELDALREFGDQSRPPKAG